MSDLNLPDNLNKNAENDQNLLRLQTFLAHAGVASRRACEKIITDGRVCVNGSPVTILGTKISVNDSVSVDGKEITPEEKKRYILLNKPTGYVCSLSDEKNRPIAADLLKPHFTERVYNVGRLDMYSSGLILFTNDGEFAAKISHPSFELEKEYLVETSLPYPPYLIERFTNGVRVNNVFYKCKQAERISGRRFSIILVEGKNREIRRVLESFDIRVKKLVRIRIGNLCIKSSDGIELAEGSFRELALHEIELLLKSSNSAN